jgi:predicted nuclease with TOPRIM domain
LIKNKYSESKIEIANLKKNLDILKSKIPSIENEKKQKEIENQKLKIIINKLNKELKDIKIKSNSIFFLRIN